MTPAFTGSKMRQMFDLICDYSEDMIQNLRQQTKTSESKLDFEVEDIFTRYTHDVIASCAFGLKVDSIKERTNDFFMENKKVFNSSGWFAIKFMFAMLMPTLARAIRLELADTKRFMSLILDTMKYRKEHGIYRPDMINIMMQLRDNTLMHQNEENEMKADAENELSMECDSSNGNAGTKSERFEWNDYEIVSQCFNFVV